MKRFLALIIFSFPISGFSQSDFAIQTLADLQKSGNIEQAYQYAVAHSHQEEGNPDFDFYFGLVAIDVGKVSQGVFALERVLLIEPENHMARLELARGYFLLEEYDRARQEFESVLDLDPPKNVQANIHRYIDAIRSQEGRYRTTTGLYFGLGAGTDDNVSSGPENLDGFNRILGFVPFAAEDSTLIQQEDIFNEISSGLQIDVPFVQGWSFFSNLDLEARQHADFEEVDSSFMQARFGLSHLSKNDRYRVSLGGQSFNLDGEEYRTTTGVGFDWQRKLTAQSQIQLFLQGDMLSYAESQSDRDSLVTTIGLGYINEFGGSIAPLFFTNLYMGAESPENDFALAIDISQAKAIAERDFYGASIGMQINLGPSVIMISALAYQDSEYGAANLFVNNRGIRKDAYSSLKLELDWIVTKDWNMHTTASFADNNSNGDVYTYNRSQFEINLRYAFSL